MGKRTRVRRYEAKKVRTGVVETKISTYWNPIPYCKNNRSIPDSVDCLYHQDYYNKNDANEMLTHINDFY